MWGHRRECQAKSTEIEGGKGERRSQNDGWLPKPTSSHFPISVLLTNMGMRMMTSATALSRASRKGEQHTKIHDHLGYLHELREWWQIFFFMLSSARVWPRQQDTTTGLLTLP